MRSTAIVLLVLATLAFLGGAVVVQGRRNTELRGRLDLAVARVVPAAEPAADGADRLLAAERRAARADERRARAESVVTAVRRDLYRAHVEGAALALEVGRLDLAAGHLERAPFELRGWEWHHLALVCELAFKTVHHEAAVTCVDVAAGRLASGDARGDVRLYNLEEDVLLWTVSAGEEPLVDVTFGPRGRGVAVVALGGGVSVLGTHTGDVLAELQPAGAKRQKAVLLDGERMVTADADHVLRLWNWSTGELIRELASHTDAVNGLAVDPQGRAFASASNDRSLRLWDVEGQPLASFEGFERGVLATVFLPGSGGLASLDHAGLLRVHPLEGGPPVRVLATGEDPAPDLAVDYQGSFTAATRAGVVQVKGDAEARPVHLPLEPGTEVQQLAVDAFGRWSALVTGDGRLHVHDAQPLTPFTRMAPGLLGSGPVLELVVAERALYFVREAGPVQMWSGQLALPLGGPGATHVAADAAARFVAFGFEDGRVTLGERTLADPGPRLHGLGMTADGSMVVAVARDLAIRTWDAATGELLVELERPTPKRAQTLACAQDASWICAVDLDGSVRVVDPRDGGVRAAFINSTLSRVTRLGYHDGRRLVLVVTHDRFVQLLKADGGERAMAYEFLDGAVRGADFHPQGTRVAIATDRGRVHIYDVETSTPLYSLQAQTTDLTGCRFSPDGRRLVVTGGDGSIEVWETQREKLY